MERDACSQLSVTRASLLITVLVLAIIALTLKDELRFGLVRLSKFRTSLPAAPSLFTSGGHNRSSKSHKTSSWPTTTTYVALCLAVKGTCGI